MHNDRMISAAARRVRRQALGLVLAGSLLLSACSGDGGEPEGEGGTSEPTGATSATADEPYLPVPDGVELTAQDSRLGLGDTATVAYEPRQDAVAALDLTVTRLEAAGWRLFEGWKIPPETKKTKPYFVYVKVRNVGNADLGGERIPLYAVDGDNKLIESSTFASTFKPCPSSDLPEKFRKGDRTSTCLVYLAPDRGDLVAVSFRPTEDFSPITWTGEVELARALRPDPKKKSDKKQGKNDKKDRKDRKKR